MSVDILVDQNKTVEASHKFDILSPGQNEITSPQANIVSNKDGKEKENLIEDLDQLQDHEIASSAMQTKKSSIKPLSDSQYLMQNQAL